MTEPTMPERPTNLPLPLEPEPAAPIELPTITSPPTLPDPVTPSALTSPSDSP